MQGIRIADALQATARVLESGTSYATALFLNIQHFDRAVMAESRLDHLEQFAKQQKIHIAEMEQTIRRQSDEISQLQETVVSLQLDLNEMVQQIKEWGRKPRDSIQRDGAELPGAASKTA